MISGILKIGRNIQITMPPTTTPRNTIRIGSIKAVKPDAIFFGGYDAQAGPMARQMKSLGMSVPLMGGETMNSAKFIELAGGPDAPIVFVPTANGLDPQPATLALELDLLPSRAAAALDEALRTESLASGKKQLASILPAELPHRRRRMRTA